MNQSYIVPVNATVPQQRMSFVMVLNFVLRHIKPMMLGGLVLGTISALPVTLRAPRYEAETRFITEAEKPPGRFLGDVVLPGTLGRGPEFYIDLLRSPIVLQSVVRAPVQIDSSRPPISLVDRYAGWLKDNPVEAVRVAAEQLSGKMTTTVSETGIISLKVTEDDPHLAAALARSVMEQVDEFNNNKRKTQASEERRFAETRLAEVERELRVAEAQWVAFLERNKIISAPALQLERDRLQDELSRKRGLANTMLQAIERAKLDEVRDIPRATVLSVALPPANPAPRPILRMGLLGFFAGMVLVGLWALARDFFRSIPQQGTSEAAEFVSLREESARQIRTPIRSLIDAVKRPPRPPLPPS